MDIDPDRGPAASSAIRALAYDAERRRLTVAFQSGAVYEYDDVPEETYREFEAAESKGRFFQERIRRQHAYSRPAEDGGERERWHVREALYDEGGDDLPDAPPAAAPHTADAAGAEDDVDAATETTHHTWRVDVLEDTSAAIEVDGRQITPVPRWLLPAGARQGDTYAVTHTRGAGRSVVTIGVGQRGERREG